MKTCKFFFQDINFEPTGIQPCCDIRSRGVPSFPYAGGPLDLREYRRHIEKNVLLLQTEQSPCQGCPELREVEGALPDAVRVELNFKTVSINHHRHLCNCKCVYCNLWSTPGKSEPYHILPALKDLQAQKALAPKCFVSWGGGESSILPDFEEACAWGMEQGFYQYVHTNALRWSPAISTLLAQGKGGVNISLDSSDAAAYKGIKGVDGWSKVLASLKRYTEASLVPGQVDLKFIIFEKNNTPGAIERFFRICRDNGIQNVLYSLNFVEVNSGRVSEKTLRMAAFFRYQAKRLGLAPAPFSISGELLKKIEEYERLFHAA